MVLPHIFCRPKTRKQNSPGHGLIPLNRQIKRGTNNFANDSNPHIPTTTACFATFNAAEGRHQMALDEESSRLTTFLLPSGRYRHLVTPKGLRTPQQTWNKVKKTITNNYRWATSCADTLLIPVPDYPTLEKTPTIHSQHQPTSRTRKHHHRQHCPICRKLRFFLSCAFSSDRDGMYWGGFREFCI